MRTALTLALASSILAAVAAAQEPQKPTPPSLAMQAATQEIYQVDLIPSGTGFSLGKPVLEGDVYVLKVWPDGALVRLPKSKVKGMAPRTSEIQKQVVYQIDLVPVGQMFARDNPALSGKTYTFHRWSGGTLMSVRQADVKKVTRLSGLEALQTYLRLFGAKAIGNLAMQGSATGSASAPAAAAQGPAGSPGQPTNWLYMGVPGVTDAWAPPPAVVSAPGDVPKAPEPQPHP